MWGGVAGNVAGAEESKEEGKKRVLFLPVVRACEANFTAIKVSQGGRLAVPDDSVAERGERERVELYDETTGEKKVP